MGVNLVIEQGTRGGAREGVCEGMGLKALISSHHHNFFFLLFIFESSKLSLIFFFVIDNKYSCGRVERGNGVDKPVQNFII